MCSTLTMCSYGNLFGSRNLTVNSILPGELAKELQPGDKDFESELCSSLSIPSCENLMLLDCRSFLAYNFKHITGALNVNCTGIGKKRLQQGKASLVDLITTEYGKEFLKSGKWAKAVVYDESTVELEKAPSSHPLKLVIMSLLSQGKEAFILRGGLKEFSQCYQNLLAVHSPEQKNDTVTSTIDRINSLAKYQQDIAKNQPNPSCPLNVRATEVIPGLFLGNSMDARDSLLCSTKNINYILNLTSTCPNYFADDSTFHYKQIKIEDTCREDIKEIIAEALGFIELALADHSSVLIHCQGGVSRSPTITIAYLMHINKLSLKEAYDFVKGKRPCIAPNLNFMGQLLEIEQKSKGIDSTPCNTTREELIQQPIFTS